MIEFVQSALASVAFLGGICGFIYWMFNLMEKRFETKLDNVSNDIARIADELREERRSKDYLYKFVIEHTKK